ncbi:hypothetical protein BDR07DRAFT_1425489 [Suillus spraguei]|nr:hypothetical protein BDR07DRAFT_1425489 [Suillus spraguei]
MYSLNLPSSSASRLQISLILDALHLALMNHCIYYYLVINHANFDALIEIVWSSKLLVVMEVLIIFPVNLCYVYRIWILSEGKSRILPITVGIAITLSSGIATVLIWSSYQYHVFSDVIEFEWSAYMGLGTITFSDIVITSSLCYLLATSRTGFSSIDSLATKLMVYMIHTGCLTSVCSIVAMITCAVMPLNFIFRAIEFLLAKVYVNSFLALLNARHYGHANTDPNASYNRHGVYRPELHIQMSEDQELRASQRNVFKHSDDETVDPSRFVKQPIIVTMEINSLSSV